MFVMHSYLLLYCNYQDCIYTSKQDCYCIQTNILRYKELRIEIRVIIFYILRQLLLLLLRNIYNILKLLIIYLICFCILYYYCLCNNKSLNYCLFSLFDNINNLFRLTFLLLRSNDNFSCDKNLFFSLYLCLLFRSLCIAYSLYSYSFYCFQSVRDSLSSCSLSLLFCFNNNKLLYLLRTHRYYVFAISCRY